MRPKIGLALGAGGAKGLAHIGVLKVLVREGIPIDLISGSSMGAIVGACYAAGADLHLMEKLSQELNHSRFADVAFPKMGLLKGDKAHQLISLLTHGKNFSELNIPFSVVATDVEAGEKVIIDSGNVAEAVRASMSVPGVFNPIKINDRLLVDGAVIERVPVPVVKNMGADFIIAVDVKFCSNQKLKVNNIYDVIMRSIEILEKEVLQSYIKLADIVIKPEVDTLGEAQFDKASEIIQKGVEAAEKAIPQIKEMLNPILKREQVN